jgi:hypothetical protein
MDALKHSYKFTHLGDLGGITTWEILNLITEKYCVNVLNKFSWFRIGFDVVPN